jgi:hypothetical protein
MVAKFKLKQDAVYGDIQLQISAIELIFCATWQPATLLFLYRLSVTINYESVNKLTMKRKF